MDNERLKQIIKLSILKWFNETASHKKEYLAHNDIILIMEEFNLTSEEIKELNLI